MFYRLCCLCVGALLLALPVQAESLYARPGGDKGVTEITNELLDLTVNSPETRRSFAKVNTPSLKQKVAEQIGSLTGGPCRYSGDTMKQSRAGLGITETELHTMGAHLGWVQNNRNVTQSDKNALLVLFAPMKHDIVEIRK